MRVTDRQVRKLFMEYQKSGKIQMAAIKAGMNRDTAAGYIGNGQLPSERVVTRDWRTRQDPFDAHWAEAEAMLRAAPVRSRRPRDIPGGAADPSPDRRRPDTRP